MTRAIGQALGFYGVNVNSLVCGPMDNPCGTAEEAGERLRRIPMGRLAKPEDLVGAAIFLADRTIRILSPERVFSSMPVTRMPRSPKTVFAHRGASLGVISKFRRAPNKQICFANSTSDIRNKFKRQRVEISKQMLFDFGNWSLSFFCLLRISIFGFLTSR